MNKPNRDTQEHSCLIVEDHPGLRASLHDWLSESLPACEILEAATGEDGLRLAVARRPSVVLMDIGLPGISGIEATRRIRQALPNQPLIMLTIDGSAAYRADALSAGADAFVTKSAVYTELLPILARLCKLSAPIGAWPT